MSRDNWFAWFKPRSIEDQLWIERYLLKQKVPLADRSMFPNNQAWLMRLDQQIQSDIDANVDRIYFYETLMKKTKAAWSQKKLRTKNGRKAYNFIMSNEIEAKLKQLNPKGTISQSLEELILNTSNIESVIKKEYEEKFSRLKKVTNYEVEQLRVKNQREQLKNSELLLKYNKVKEINTNLESTLKEIFYIHAKYLEIFKINDNDPETELTPAQDRKARTYGKSLFMGLMKLLEKEPLYEDPLAHLRKILVLANDSGL
ncbi:hypothetical protein [Aquirhabdus sp.]|uniref:hypothetical protein n=1 Tax=Aquirhabdus sp. TaxID=2824160 RepID=UPI00396C8071